VAPHERVDWRRDERAGDGLQRDERYRRTHQCDGRTHAVEHGRKVDAPMASFDGVAETPERARRRLREDTEVDEISVDAVFQRA
jgi:hypothetical protein